MQTLFTTNSFKLPRFSFLRKIQLFILPALLLLLSSCHKEDPRGAIPISGVGFYAETDECDYPSQGADYALRMTGDLTGCLYAFVDDFKCADGNYVEKGRELFVGTYKGHPGTFRTTYIFKGKYEGCNKDGSPAGAEISGGCHHPIIEGSGDGVFTGVTGFIDFVDNVETGDFPYTGHLKF